MHSPKKLVVPSLSPQHRRHLDTRPWTDAEVEHALERLDETGIWLMANYGTAMTAAYECGEWAVCVSGLTVSARRLAVHYHLDDAVSECRQRSRHRRCRDAILLAAGLEAVDDRRVRDMAGKLAPISRSLFGSRAAGEMAMLKARQKLFDASMLGFVRSAYFRERFGLTDAGRVHLNRVVYPVWEEMAIQNRGERHPHGDFHD